MECEAFRFNKTTQEKNEKRNPKSTVGVTRFFFFVCTFGRIRNILISNKLATSQPELFCYISHTTLVVHVP